MHHDDVALEQESVPLAWDRHGRRFSVPKHATSWRVLRKREGRGRPTVVSTPRGPLHIEIHASVEMLSQAVRHQLGWYVLHAVDANMDTITNCPSAHVEVVAELTPAHHCNGPCEAIDRLCTIVQQLVLYSMQRDEAMCQALGQMTAALTALTNLTGEGKR